MLLKRLFFGGLLLTAFVIIQGCATNGEPKDDYSTRYRNASNECLRFGYRRNSYDYHRCIERRVGSEKEDSSQE
jgi:hypothetical protein